MRGERRLAATVALATLAAAGAMTAGWLRPTGIVGMAIGTLYQIDAPDRFDDAMVRRGAGHYDRVCARCHGSPERPDKGRDLALVPPPPTLHLRLDGWPPERLFQVVRDGIPNSAMPAWPARAREDEIWSMVAFLAVLPHMDADAYRRAAGTLPAPVADMPPVVRVCAQCHGTDGRGQGLAPQAFPRLDLQAEVYLRDSLLAFRDGRRASGVMQAATIGLTDAEIAVAARHYAQAPQGSEGAADVPPLVARGDAARKIGACAACHGTTSPVRPEIPRLAGQHAAYLIRQLRLFTDEESERGGGPLVGLMQHAAGNLDEADMQAIARWYAARPEEPRGSP